MAHYMNKEEEQIPYKHKSYPMWLYRQVTKEDGTKDVLKELVRDPRQQDALGPGWAESPLGPWPTERPEPEMVDSGPETVAEASIDPPQPPAPPPVPRPRKKARS